MEGSESEAIFESLNVNPQLFINDVLNTVDDLVRDAFDYYLQQASNDLKTDGTDRSQDLTKGVYYIHRKIQSVLDERLAMWEQYCLHHCFGVPEGFSLPKSDELPCNTSMIQDAVHDSDLDAELDSLRNKLALIAAESAKLNSKLRELEQQSNSNGQCARLVNEAVQLYEQNSVHDMFQEMMKTASELRVKFEKIKAKRVEDKEHARAERICNPHTDDCRMQPEKGLANVSLDNLQEFLAELKKT
ncbi:hypothetical protein SLE2022_365020 [Rubroshorea leprosula]